MQTSEKDVLLRYENFSVTREKQCILAPLSLCLRAHEVLAIVGESGAGKSTTLRAALASLAPEVHVSGKVFLLGKDILSLSAKERRTLYGTQIAFLPQNPTQMWNPLRTLDAQFRDVFFAHGKGAFYPERAIRAFHACNLSEALLHRYPFELSGGQQQRAAFALTTVLSPTVLLADEPTSALDALVAKQLLDQMRHYADGGKGVLFVTHNLRAAAYIADSIGVMQAGKIIEVGSAHELYQHPKQDYTQELLRAASLLRK